MAFKDIIGHDQPIRRLQKYLQAGRFQGAYLFSGPEGIGKSLVAKTLAKALNCQHPQNDSCDLCPSCIKIEKGQHPDVHCIDVAAAPLAGADTGRQRKTENISLEIKIEYIRQLQEKISFKPYEGKKKIFIINDAHTMNQEASNAFLKALEEPPKDSVIVLLSAKPALLLRTIVSRCQTVKFSCLSREALEDILKQQYHLESMQTHFLSYFCEGRIGAALRLKERDIVGEKNRIIDQCILNPKSFSRWGGTFSRQDMRDTLTVMVTWFRDAYLLKVGLPKEDIINLDRRDELRTFSGRYTLTDLDEIVQMISNSFVYVEQNVNVKLLLSTIQATLTR